MKAIRGFSLLEILIALVIMSVAMTGVLMLFGSAQVKSRKAEALSIGTMLARKKMAEVSLDMEKRIAEGKIPQDDEHEEGTFDTPFERYQWSVEVRKVELPLPPVQDEKAGLMQVFMQTISKQIAEAVREIKLTVTWTVRNQEQKVSVATHVVSI